MDPWQQREDYPIELAMMHPTKQPGDFKFRFTDKTGSLWKTLSTNRLLDIRSPKSSLTKYDPGE